MSLPDFSPLPWMTAAECVNIGVPPDLWFPSKGETMRDARAICSQCQVRQECADYVDSFEPNRPDDMFGMWAGESPAQRYARRRAAREAAA